MCNTLNAYVVIVVSIVITNPSSTKEQTGECVRTFYMNQLDVFYVQPDAYLKNITELILFAEQKFPSNNSYQCNDFVTRDKMVIVINSVQRDCENYIVTSKAEDGTRHIKLELICPAHIITILSCIICIMGFILLIMVIILLRKTKETTTEKTR